MEIRVSEVEETLIYICDDNRHLICYPYTVPNLHKATEDLGIKQCWYHAGKYPHYDIPPCREVEIMGRCRAVNRRVIFAIITGKADALAGLPLLGATAPGPATGAL